MTTRGRVLYSWYIYLCRDLGKRKVPLNFCIQALYFKLDLYIFKAGPLNKYSNIMPVLVLIQARTCASLSYVV